ncbi:TMV resistance protein N-like [Pyrus x bretschneideri]|uniref:TMV resistance protein N-like n=1 Tax=Pyrus x bretschneideri TaxID=225117 RepID=UPI00202FCD36|nr:TMV resistance protein N-like [Pyrus x bretschneideri]
MNHFERKRQIVDDGADTRKGFTDHLYSALELAGIHTFRDDDDEIERGTNIEWGLQTAIQESRVSVIVFSKDYASSRWCLNELAIIMERKRRDGHMVIPVFYDVEPSDVRKAVLQNHLLDMKSASRTR